MLAVIQGNPLLQWQINRISHSEQPRGTAPPLRQLLRCLPVLAVTGLDLTHIQNSTLLHTGECRELVVAVYRITKNNLRNKMLWHEVKFFIDTHLRLLLVLSPYLFNKHFHDFIMNT